MGGVPQSRPILAAIDFVFKFIEGNISHRIEKFNFGPRISGLVAPLSGAEQISESGNFQYKRS